ncbi:response regulator [Sphaerospermopsis aphanizomenoides BCCUSP55]|uniref:hybrid sensor histidine kinase/response regulator n=1 Tax=Sphaerospermopsis aphanizomenoides TaxID=459663 RepID=UPI0019088FA5|nr:ATP-binding protein [Sphaerospermopsis aphanizomenoides]MBK1990393.1 response regulator [Sphaerospermopsis aphanizomenoides BCCUSP55]
MTYLSPSDRLLRGIATAMNQLLTVEDDRQSVQSALNILGIATEVDRIYIFENHLHPETGQIAISQRWEWVAEGVVPEIDNPDLQNLTYDSFLPRWYEVLSQQQPIVGKIADLPLVERMLLEPQGILAILIVPIFIRDQFWGFVGFDDCHQARDWDETAQTVLMAIASSIGGAIAQRKAESHLKQLNETLEERVKMRTAELQRSIEAADAANRAKSEFLANMSHELRSPLNAILGFAQIMTRSQTLGLEHQENVGIISRSGEHLLALINNVLDLSKIEAGKTTLNPKNFDLHRLLDDIHDMFQMKAEEKNLQLIMEYEPDLVRYVRTDEIKLRQVLINLIHNAIKFTQTGGISIRVNNHKMTLHPQQTIALSQRDAYTLNFEIEDTGAGIAPEELGELFNAFSQTATGRQAQEGTGLGLPISRQFVSLMGGDMKVKSQVEKGTTFFFNIQVTTVNADEITRQQTTRRVIALAPNQPTYRLLIVDDKPLNRQLLIKLLSPLGFQLQEASNGQEAVNIWETWEPHLIWMDMRMPVMDGYSATQMIKATTKGQATVVIAITASVLEEEKAVVLSAGCDDFLRKPFREEEIFQSMNKHIGVNYIYEELTPINSEIIHTKEILTVDAISKLPPELLQQLQEAVIASNLDLIAQVIQKISICNAPLSQAIETCLHNFEYEKILHLLPETQV